MDSTMITGIVAAFIILVIALFILFKLSDGTGSPAAPVASKPPSLQGVRRSQDGSPASGGPPGSGGQPGSMSEWDQYKAALEKYW
jgi:hypothetical protein